MACADIEMDIHQAESELHTTGRRKPTLVRYQATELMPEKGGLLHDLLKKEPAVLGLLQGGPYPEPTARTWAGTVGVKSLQVMSGLFSVAVGIVLAITQDLSQSLFTLFRVSQLTGVLFIFAGVVSNLLFKYPVLLSVSFKANCSCIIMAAVAASLIIVDLSHWTTLENENEQLLKMEVFELCVLGLEVFLSAVLCFWFFKEKRSKSP